MSGRELSDERTRELYQQSLAARAGGARDRCASPEAILALVRREGAEEERLATLDHVMACEACSREFELLRAIERAGSEAGVATESAPSTAAARARWRWQRIAPLALAASLLLAAGIGILRDRGAVPAPDVVRGAEEEVTLVAPGADVGARTPVTFVWRAVPGASRYVLELLAPDGTVVFDSTIPDTALTLREPARLAPGTEYRWWVRAIADGGAQAASPLRRLRVRSE